jgi:uncharacterized membrane protein
MVGQLVGGSLVIIAGILMIVFRNWSMNVRLRWYDEHMPRLRPNRSVEMIGYIFGSLVVIAFGVLLIAAALS